MLNEHENLEHALSASSILSRTNSKGIITSVNANFVKISGYSETELIGSSHNIVNSNYHPKQFWVDMWKTISMGISWRGEVRNRAKNGSFYWVDTFIYPFISKSGKPLEYFSVRNDITEKKGYESDILQQNKLLAEITWKQSHEMRRPVASILGLLQLIQSESSLCKNQKEIIDRLKSSVDELDLQIKSIVRQAEKGELKSMKNYFVACPLWSRSHDLYSKNDGVLLQQRQQA
ncbi:PAS domain S-box protein [Chryseolinea lacunae]|uniref:histidine kinase n=1 Tax=Chryseolinea lacunae TaxID=2801331 RepID=A0ABS1KPN5_9BACT|nr:PAS domain S-box protein [Chryseolinea lacunae]MBL0741405.1 PAS domain S-box protein [Chryseolinea lacunae]